MLILNIFLMLRLYSATKWEVGHIVLILFFLEIIEKISEHSIYNDTELMNKGKTDHFSDIIKNIKERVGRMSEMQVSISRRSQPKGNRSILWIGRRTGSIVEVPP